MKPNFVCKLLLTAFVILATADLLQSLRTPPRVLAQSLSSGSGIYVEPGTTMLRAPDGSRQVLGKVIIDLSSGNVWGFPTTVEQPYPIDMTTSAPPTSKPFLLGKFDFSQMRNAR
jgi:hypothetical protein